MEDCHRQWESPLNVRITHGLDVALLEEDDVHEEAERHHGDDDDGYAPADHVGPVGVLVAAGDQWLPAVPAERQDRLTGGQGWSPLSRDQIPVSTPFSMRAPSQRQLSYLGCVYLGSRQII